MYTFTRNGAILKVTTKNKHILKELTNMNGVYETVEAIENRFRELRKANAQAGINVKVKIKA